MVKGKNVSIVKFKESDTYKFTLNTTITEFLIKERLKMKWLLRSHHQIKNLFFLAKITDEPIFFSTDDDEEEKKEEVNQ